MKDTKEFYQAVEEFAKSKGGVFITPELLSELVLEFVKNLNFKLTGKPLISEPDKNFHSNLTFYFMNNQEASIEDFVKLLKTHQPNIHEFGFPQIFSYFLTFGVCQALFYTTRLSAGGMSIIRNGNEIKTENL